MTDQSNTHNELRERLAANAHDAWARWTSHLLSKTTRNGDGSLNVSEEVVARWRRQIDTPYEQLTHSEQFSDRAEADIILKIVAQSNQQIDS